MRNAQAYAPREVCGDGDEPRSWVRQGSRGTSWPDVQTGLRSRSGRDLDRSGRRRNGGLSTFAPWAFGGHSSRGEKVAFRRPPLTLWDEVCGVAFGPVLPIAIAAAAGAARAKQET